MSALGFAWRFAALGGAGLGLALAPLRPPLPATPALLLGFVVVLALSRPRGAGRAAWLSLVAAVALLLGLALGAARLEAIDSGALRAPEDARVELCGEVVSTPRISAGTGRFTMAVAGKRIGVETRGDLEGVDEGRIVAVAGTVRLPAPWEADTLAREGASRVIDAGRVRPTAAVRGGVRGALDAIRRRAEAALERGTPPASAALLRGFVLGQDDRIPEPVRDEFRRSALAHLLAVSGQNVMLLVLLATPIVAIAGVALRTRLLLLVALIAVYVPVAGAGPSIQRAGVMGAAGLVAALAGRPRARWYALLLAVAVTLALDPRATGDVGWQLSFAAVGGLLLLAAPVARLLAGAGRSGWARRLVAEGAAMTLAATLATAPLIAHHFGMVSLTALPANLLALPAVAPAMWLGMLSGALGQIPGAPVEPLTALGGLCAGFIGWVARALGGAPAQIEIPEPGLGVAAALSFLLLLAARLGCAALARRPAMRPAWRPRGRRRAFAAAGVVAAIALAGGLLAHGDPRDARNGGPAPALALSVLDVGQGDAILLQPRDTAPLLIDTGPPGGEAVSRLAELGVDRLGALVITHDELDHSGALPELLERVAVERLIVSPGSPPAHCRRAACPEIVALAAGDAIRAGKVRLEVLWPREGDEPSDGADPNARSLVLRGRLGSFTALLAGDAEAEVAPVDPGRLDLLKVAHHGSADAGLAALLARTSPRLAAISTGRDNPHGHPAPETLAALDAAGVATRRTDTGGEIRVEVRSGGWTVE